MMSLPADSIALLQRLSQMIRQGHLTQSQVAEATNVNQSQISRILSGQIKRTSRNVARLCEYVESLPIGQLTMLDQRQALSDAALELWDGSDEHAKVLRQLFSNLRELQTHSREQSR